MGKPGTVNKQFGRLISNTGNVLRCAGVNPGVIGTDRRDIKGTGSFAYRSDLYVGTYPQRFAVEQPGDLNREITFRNVAGDLDTFFRVDFLLKVERVDHRKC